MIYAIEADSRTLLFRLDAGELDHLGPRLDFVGDDLTEIGRRADKHRSSEFSELRLYLGIGQASIDFLVQRGDDFVRSERFIVGALGTLEQASGKGKGS